MHIHTYKIYESIYTYLIYESVYTYIMYDIYTCQYNKTDYI